MTNSDESSADQAPPYAEGQVWEYRTRPGEETSTIQINKIEAHPRLNNIYHISIFGVHVVNYHVPGGRVQTRLPHSPVSEQTLNSSVTRLVDLQTPDPVYLSGYQEWKRVFDEGKAGIFTITIAEIVDFVQHALTPQ